MLAAALLAATVQVPVIEPIRLRTVLPSKAVVMVERIPAARAVTVQLWVSAAPAPETYATHGWRHLLEHLVARGNGSVDQKVETAGGFLRAETYRTSTVFSIVAPKGAWTTALECLHDMARFPEVTPERIAKEADILVQEGLLRTPADRMASSLWEKAYKEAGLDPFGNLDTIRGATPDDLRALYRKLFVLPGMVVTVSGDIDLDVATQAATAALAGLPPEPEVPKLPSGVAHPILYEGPGGARAVPVGSFRDPDTVAVLAAALGAASEIPGSFVTYTPSNEKGLIIVGHPSDADILNKIDGFRPDDLFGRGRSLARLWLEKKLRDPAARGLLLVQARDLRPEIGDENLTSMSTARFANALAQFRKGKALETAE
ncbi:hypothetical protein BH11ARM2_BH11ARM2_14590 [soil metagenome]